MFEEETNDAQTEPGSEEKAAEEGSAQETARAADKPPAAEPQTGPQITGDFDPERAANTIVKQRKEVRQLKDKLSARRFSFHQSM
jgi:hypothetical protein